MEYILGLVALVAVVCLALVVIQAMVYVRQATNRIHNSEVELRTHLQAQVDDLHGKLLNHTWEAYANTVGQRSAFDRAVSAEEVRRTPSFRDPDEVDRELANMGVGAFDDDGYEGGPIVG